MPPQPPSFGSKEYWNKRFTSNSSPFEWLEAPTALDPYIVAALKDNPDSDPQLLHIGCGTSLLSYHLRAHVSNPERIHNLDYSEVAVEVGRKREVDIFKWEPELLRETAEAENESRVAAEEAVSRESERLGKADEVDKPDASQLEPDESSKPSYMRWSAANLLNHSSLLEACQPSAYSIIVDKSTSDSIACSEDICVPLPYYITTSEDVTASTNLSESPEPIHPLHIMGIHLAVLAQPKARWISLSYSMDRYPFLPLPPADPPPGSSTEPSETHVSASASAPAPMPASTATATCRMGESTSAALAEEQDSEDDMSLDDDLDDIPRKVIDSGFPDPSLLWKLVGKYDIEPPPPSAPANGSSGDETVHRPKVMHWVYVLERTDMKVFVKNSN